nr:MAG TPA: Transcriptional regulator, Transcriptional activator, TPR, HTH [Caudoviricetes sp.]
MDAKQIGEVIKEARKRKGMTQEEQLANMLGIGILTASFYKNGVFKAIPFNEHAKMSSALNIPNEGIACISTNEAVDELKEQEKLIKAVNAELEEWLCSGDTDYLYKAMAIIRAEIDNEE